mmetsp:Transcript_42417/g.40665  ORF Transcript_42417/g.40665 Transcript_42417/m.40665 type:complete len:88 (+) Transcript_42417:1611-1874(+)
MGLFYLTVIAGELVEVLEGIISDGDIQGAAAHLVVGVGQVHLRRLIQRGHPLALIPVLCLHSILYLLENLGLVIWGLRPLLEADLLF